MASFNRVLLIGNLTADPILRTLPQTGMQVTDLRMAINRRWTSKDGTPRDEVCFIDVTVWAQSAENCCRYLKKGSSVHVEGYLKQESWDAPTGEKRYKHKVIADSVVFLDRRDGAGGPGGGSGGGYPSHEEPPADDYAPPPPRPTAAAAPRQSAPQRDYGGGSQAAPAPNRGAGGGGGSYGRNYSAPPSAHDPEEDIPF